MATEPAKKRAVRELDVGHLLHALLAVRNGDFTTRLPVEWTGTAGRVADAFNDCIELNQMMARELARIRQVVGIDGRIDQRAQYPDVGGEWRGVIESVNTLIDDMGRPTNEISRVIGAVAKGDLTQRMLLDVDGVPLKGEFLRTATTVNTMVDQLSTFASEVTRVAREVGTEGKLGGQAQVPNVSGTWKDLTENVNLMASNLTTQVRSIAEVTTAVATGDLSKKITVDVRGELMQLKDTINVMVDNLNTFAGEVTRVAREVGTDGKLGGQAQVKGVAGTWKDLTDNVNLMASNLTGQVRSIAGVTTAVANGDLTKKIIVEAKGEILELKNTINTMVDQLSTFAGEVTRVAREVGTEGQLGGQAEVPGVGGTWKDLTDSVNLMAGSLTTQVRNIAEVTTAVANGDLSKKITVDVRGELLELKDTINTMVDQLSTFASEVTRVAREVGAEGKLGGQAEVKGVGGTWKDLTESVNFMAGSLTSQVRNIAEVTTAVANGDLSKKITVAAKGEILELKSTVNTMVDQLSTFASEVTRVAREVGAEGKLGGQAEVKGVGGTWRDLTESVNFMAGSLTSQVRNIAEVTTAIANGDLSRKITVESKGELLQLKNTINKMVDYLNQLAGEVGRVTRAAGEEGKLTELTSRAAVEGATGAWKEIVDTLNFLLDALSMPVTEIGRLVTAISEGDLSQKMPLKWKNDLAVARGDKDQKMQIKAAGDIRTMAETINQMVDNLNTFAGEVTRVAREVGTEGILGGQAEVPGVAGTWKDLTDSVNFMASNLTSQVRNIATVTTAVANGDLTKKITVEAKGEILELKDTINIMVDQLSTFASEVTRVAREVGTDGKLGGQAEVPGVGGTWKDLTDSVNSMASSLTGQVRNIAEVTTAIANGDLSRKITVDVRGELLELKDTINTMVDQLSTFASEVTRVAREVGTDGKLGGQAYVPNVAGTWKDLTDSVNFMAGNLTSQVRNIAAVTTAVANGDLTKKITVDVRGELLELKDTVNVMVDQLSTFASEVTRVAREVGTDGKLGGQAEVKGVGGTWKDLTDSVNFMAGNLTDQVRGIASVVTAVAEGNLKKKVTFEAKGEIASLADTINAMTDTLATFADQVISVAREVGNEGKLGAQAMVPGAAGSWKDLTDNVNGLARNLTDQVRAISEVAQAVTQGDLTRSITVEAKGEVGQLKDTVNTMITNLKDTTDRNSEQDWLKTNLAKFTRMLQGQNDLNQVAKMLLAELAPLVSAQHGIFYIMETEDSVPVLKLLSAYAHRERKSLANRFELGEGLVGECALEKERILLTSVPADYVQISSGLGEATPLNVVVLPVVFEGDVKAVVELASFSRFSQIHVAFLDQLTESLGIVLNTIEANMRTEGLLQQSQGLAEELQTQQEELQQTNEELEEKAQALVQQKTEVETKNREIEQARQALEDKAEQLAITSKYKSEFLSNMSHELRTPLNSLLILAEQLAQNPEKNLSNKQIDFASTIHSSGNDLLTLINDILDLSKIESGTVTLDISDIPLVDIKSQMERTFSHMAKSKNLDFGVDLAKDLPATISSDSKRLLQVLKNLMSNAFKFTEKGSIYLRAAPATEGWSPDIDTLNRADQVIAFAVSDTGIGIPKEKQKIVFEAFQQADGSTTRKYGGTGLGLPISREIARLLGGEIRLKSEPGKGSSFTLYVPQRFLPPTDSPTTRRAPEVREPAGQSGAPSAPAAAGDLTESIEAAARDALEAAEAAAPGTAEPAPAAPEIEEVPESRPQRAPARQSAGAPEVAKAEDDRADIRPGDKVLLVIEDDFRFADVLRDMAQERAFKTLVASDGETGVAMARQYKPTAITLDIRLPEIDGWTVLDRLKLDPATRHIPVHIITVEAEERERGLQRGAFAYMTKPVSKATLDEAFSKIEEYAERKARNLLVVEDDELQCKAIAELIGNGDIKNTMVGTGAEALSQLDSGEYDCMVLDLGLPDMTGFELIDQIQTKPHLRDLPIIVYTGKELTKKDTAKLERVAKSVIVKGVASPERLLDETSLFLHRVAAEMPETKKKTLERIYQTDAALAGKRVLVVDDDVRNIFALTSMLERHDVKVTSAENGKDAIECLNKTPGVDAVLMDVMMPEMDGYDTTRAIRKMAKLKNLPIIALTAKAMKGDREKCIAAGASDYIAKPVDTEQLLSLLRVWLYK